MGIASSAKDRSGSYITGEVERGHYVDVYEVPLNRMRQLDNYLKNYFRPYHHYRGGGTEFYERSLIDLVEPYLQLLNIEYKRLSKEEIETMERIERLHQLKHLDKIKKFINKINVSNFIEKLNNKKNEKNTDETTMTLLHHCTCKSPNIERFISGMATLPCAFEMRKGVKPPHSKKRRGTKNIVEYKPRDYQTHIIQNALSHFQENNKGLLVLTCGVGKTLISLWITQMLNSKTILVGVPSQSLLEQWKNVICGLFGNISSLIVSGNITPEKIINFLESNRERCIVITTYKSAHKVLEATQQTRFEFDMKINDECHHLTTCNIQLENTTKTYIQMLHIPSVKQLSLTATLKLIEPRMVYGDNEIISNDNEEHFGAVIDKKCLLWAINEKIICDYAIQTMTTDEEQLEQHFAHFYITEENDKRLFLSAYAALESIFKRHSHHLLVYANCKNNSSKIINFIKLLLTHNYFNMPDLFYSDYNSNIQSDEKKRSIIREFETASFGIITCVYCLGEGWDFPLLDAVVFAENMHSNIRIVQSSLRGSRKNKNDPNKIAKIILPIFNSDWLENNENQDFKKTREIIYQMGLEDETIMHKIKVFRMNIEKHEPTSTANKMEEKVRETIEEFGEYDDELTRRLTLKTIARAALAITYEKARKIIADQRITSKEGYYELCERDVRLSKEPEVIFKGHFTNWIEYLSVERVYYDLDTCKSKVKEYLTNHIELKKLWFDLYTVCCELCKLDVQFPPYGLWVDYYNVKDIKEIISISIKKKQRGAVLYGK
jgi:superfamily II DNA or RNA helicase